MTAPRPTLGNERENWRRFAANAFATATYWSMLAALVVGAIGFPWVSAAFCAAVFGFALPAVVLGRL
jgi:cytochrome b561